MIPLMVIIFLYLKILLYLLAKFDPNVVLPEPLIPIKTKGPSVLV